MAVAGAMTVLTIWGGQGTAGSGDLEASTPNPPGAGEVRLPAPGELEAARGEVVAVQPAAMATCTADLGSAPPCTVVELRSGGSSAPPVLLDDRAVVVIEGWTVARLELPGGTVTWRSAPFGRDRPAAVVVGDGLLFATAPEAVVRLDPASGEVLWRVRPDHAVATAPAIRWFRDALLVLHGTGRLTALEPSDGRLRWQVRDAGSEILRIAPDGWSTSSRGASPRTPRGSGRARPDGTVVLPIDRVDGIGSVVLTPAATPDELLVRGLDAAGNAAWDTGPLPLPCCSVHQAAASDDVVVLAAPSDAAVIIDAATGRVVEVLRAEGRSLVGVDRDVGLWRTDEGLVGLRSADGVELFRAAGQLAAVEPIVIQDGAALVHIALGDRLPGRAPSRPLR